MLLREPEGNFAHVYNNDNNNASIQQVHRHTWIDAVNVTNSNIIAENCDTNSNTHSLSYRENQLREALSNALNFNSTLTTDVVECNQNCQTTEDLNNQQQDCKDRLDPPEDLDLSISYENVPSTCVDFSPDEGLFDYEEEQSYSSSTASTQDEDDKMFDPSLSDDSSSNDKIIIIPRGIHNPNYPGFQHLAYTLQEYSILSPTSYENISEISHIFEDFDKSKSESSEYADELNNNYFVTESLDQKNNLNENKYNNDTIAKHENESTEKGQTKNSENSNYEKSIEKFTVESVVNIINDNKMDESETQSQTGNLDEIIVPEKLKMENNNDAVEMTESADLSESLVNAIKTTIDDAYMSTVAEELLENDNCVQLRLLEAENNSKNNEFDINCNDTFTNQEKDANTRSKTYENSNKLTKKTSNIGNNSVKDVNETHTKLTNNSKMSNKKNKLDDSIGEFDVYNIETAMPAIDLDAIENHLRAAREEERRRRNDREEIRKRLAMGTEHEDYYTAAEKPGRKPSLQARLQSGMNLQICFMNETASDTESPSDIEVSTAIKRNSKMQCIKEQIKFECPQPQSDKYKNKKVKRPSTLLLNESNDAGNINFSKKIDFFECQAKLQTEARMALAQAKEVARMQMEVERQRRDKSPITEMLKYSLEKAGIRLSEDRRRVSRQILTDINVTQLQVIVNELHTQIERLNEVLVELLIARDELHMGQDSMLVDIEDLTRHLGAKDAPSRNLDSSGKHSHTDKPINEEKCHSSHAKVTSSTSFITSK